MINEQCRLFLLAILYGMGACLSYDLLRILRRLIPHSLFFIHAEDLVFWVLAVLLLYYGMLVQANGVIRAYYFVGIVLGVIIAEGTIGQVLLNLCHITKKNFGKSKKTIDE